MYIYFVKFNTSTFVSEADEHQHKTKLIRAKMANNLTHKAILDMERLDIT